MKKFWVINSMFSVISAVFLAAVKHDNSDACLAWGVVAILGFGNFCTRLADLLEDKEAA